LALHYVFCLFRNAVIDILDLMGIILLLKKVVTLYFTVFLLHMLLVVVIVVITVHYAINQTLFLTLVSTCFYLILLSPGIL